MPRWNAGRVVLIGDACQCVSPLAGQGASMAVAAAYVLAEELHFVGEQDLAVALMRYERRVKPAIEREQKAGRRMAVWFVPEDAAHVAIRSWIARAMTWPVVPAMIRRRMAAESVFA